MNDRQSGEKRLIFYIEESNTVIEINLVVEELDGLNVDNVDSNEQPMNLIWVQP